MNGSPEVTSLELRSESRLDELRLALLWRLRPSELRRLREEIAAGNVRLASDQGSGFLAAALPENLKSYLSLVPSKEEALRVSAQLESLSIRFLLETDLSFPSELRVIPDPPAHLFLRGEPLRALERPRVAVVGSRAASRPGLDLAYGLGRDLALSGCVVVSGLARGIDGEAHRGALDGGGETVAVLGTGPDRCYPPENEELYAQILARGGVVSEFPPGALPLPLHFPRRNRILAGLADVVVVVEGGVRSGARSTVDHALDQGKDVLALPRDPLHPGSVLPNRLLRDGARPVLSHRDVLEVLANLPGRSGRERHLPEAGRGSALSELDRKVMSVLARKVVRAESCQGLIPDMALAEIQAALLRLEVMGWIQRLPGGRYRRTADSALAPRTELEDRMESPSRRRAAVRRDALALDHLDP